MKRCCKCHIFKPLTDFYADKTRKDGCARMCKECISSNKLIWRNKNPKFAWCVATRYNHKKKGFIISITNSELYSYIEHQTHCQLCGVKLSFTNNKTSNNSPSLDRVDNEHNISFNNVQLLCVECNRTKGTKTMKEFIKYCNMITSKFKGDD